jgi:hypothetical protein
MMKTDLAAVALSTRWLAGPLILTMEGRATARRIPTGLDRLAGLRNRRDQHAHGAPDGLSFRARHLHRLVGREELRDLIVGQIRSQLYARLT